MKKVAVLASGAGSTFKYLYDNLNSEVDFAFVGVDRKADVEILAKGFGIKVENVKQDLLSVIDKYTPDLIVLAGYLSMIPIDVVKKYSGRIINVHPSLLPKYGGKGYYGLKVHKAVKANNEKLTGATVHFVNEEYDKGCIIAQRFINVEELDLEEIESRVKFVEKRLLTYVVRELLEAESRC